VGGLQGRGALALADPLPPFPPRHAPPRAERIATRPRQLSALPARAGADGERLLVSGLALPRHDITPAAPVEHLPWNHHPPSDAENVRAKTLGSRIWDSETRAPATVKAPTGEVRKPSCCLVLLLGGRGRLTRLGRVEHLAAGWGRAQS
jgi:hypothetical protein